MLRPRHELLLSRMLTELAEEAEAKLAGQNSLALNNRHRTMSVLGSHSEVCHLPSPEIVASYWLQYSSPPNEPAFPRMVHSASDLEALSAASSPSVSRGPWSPLDGGCEDPGDLVPPELLDEL